MKSWIIRIAMGALGLALVALLVLVGMVILPSTPIYKGPDVALPGVRKRLLKVNGLKLHIAEAGKPSAPLIIFLHGFPEFWYEWRAYLPHFAKKGYYAVAPDQRGYNLSDKPKGISSYDVSILAKDIEALIHALGRKKAYIVAHDWGAMVAWQLAMTAPQKVRKMVIINVPHPEVFKRALTKSAAQRKRSWYIGFFQLPVFPEKFMARHNWKAASRALTGTSLPGAYTEADLVHYRRAWSRPGAMTSMMNWYRAAFARRNPSAATKKLWAAKVQPPTLVLWGAQDRALGKDMAQPSANKCRDGRLVLFPKATHWVVHERIPQIQKQISDFFPLTKTNTPTQ